MTDQDVSTEYYCEGQPLGCEFVGTEAEREAHEDGCDLAHIEHSAQSENWIVNNPIWVHTTGQYHRPQRQTDWDKWQTACGKTLHNPKWVLMDAPLASLPRLDDVCARCGEWPEDSFTAKVVQRYSEVR